MCVSVHYPVYVSVAQLLLCHVCVTVKEREKEREVVWSRHLAHAATDGEYIATSLVRLGSRGSFNTVTCVCV
uniref:Putative secreted peptide n=1 Tax=Anopheles braziliensis TaxID=58242 RepID=A0A2M3ZNY2_9DIPT